MTFLSLASYRSSHTKKRFFPVCLSVTLILSIEKHFFTQNFPNMDNIKQIMLNIDSHLKEWTDSKYIILNIGNETSQGQFFISFFFFPPRTQAHHHKPNHQKHFKSRSIEFSMRIHRSHEKFIYICYSIVRFWLICSLINYAYGEICSTIIVAGPFFE